MFEKMLFAVLVAFAPALVGAQLQTRPDTLYTGVVTRECRLEISGICGTPGYAMDFQASGTLNLNPYIGLYFRGAYSLSLEAGNRFGTLCYSSFWSPYTDCRVNARSDPGAEINSAGGVQLSWPLMLQRGYNKAINRAAINLKGGVVGLSHQNCLAPHSWAGMPACRMFGGEAEANIETWHEPEPKAAGYDVALFINATSLRNIDPEQPLPASFLALRKPGQSLRPWNDSTAFYARAGFRVELRMPTNNANTRGFMLQANGHFQWDAGSFGYDKGILGYGSLMPGYYYQIGGCELQLTLGGEFTTPISSQYNYGGDYGNSNPYFVSTGQQQSLTLRPGSWHSSNIHLNAHYRF